MTALAPLPVNADDGFPQAFLFAVDGDSYGVLWYVDIAESQLPPARLATPTTLIDVSGAESGTSGKREQTDATPHGILIMAVSRQDPSGLTPLLRRRVIPGLSYAAGRLQIAVDAAAIALGNLNAAGSYGSVLDVRVGAA